MAGIYLAGAENPSHQKLLRACGAQQVAVNVGSLARRRPGAWQLDMGPDYVWVAYTDDADSEFDALQLALDGADRPPLYVVGPAAWGGHGMPWMPLWTGVEELPDTADAEGYVVTDRVFGNINLQRQALSQRTESCEIGVITGSTDQAIRKFDLVISGSWWSVMKYGETQVWDGRRMHRYNANRKDEARAQHEEDIRALGVDYDLIVANDPDENAQLAITSWAEMSKTMDRNTSVQRFEDAPQLIPVGSEPVTAPQVVDTTPPPVRHKRLLPVMGLDTITATTRQVDGTELVEQQSVLTSADGTIRRCNNCYLGKAGCPAFTPGDPCAYEMPVKIESSDQLSKVLQVIVELQTQRVLQARFAEEVAGQELSAETGREMDRLFKLVERMKNITDNRDTMKLTLEAKGNNGMVSRLFGEKVGANARMLSQPVDSNVLLAEVIED